MSDDQHKKEEEEIKKKLELLNSKKNHHNAVHQVKKENNHSPPKKNQEAKKVETKHHHTHENKTSSHHEHTHSENKEHTHEEHHNHNHTEHHPHIVQGKNNTNHQHHKHHKPHHHHPVLAMNEEKKEIKENREIEKVETRLEEINLKRGVVKKKLDRSPPNLRTDKEIAMDFAIKIHERFDKLIKASILFGSQAKNVAKVGSDIDIIVLLDDASISWDLELISWYREELSKLVNNFDYGKELHINTVKLTTWWYDLLHGDPVVINILRYGEGLIDSGGFFNPIKSLLIQGKIHSTPEAVYAALQRAPAHLARSRASEIGAIEGVYWTMVDSAQAALMTAGKLPPSPEHIPELLKETFVDKGVLKINSVNSMRELYNLHKSISHGEVSSITGVEIDKWQSIADKFLGDMTKLINDMLDAAK